MSEKMTFRAKEVSLRSLHSLDVEVTVEVEDYDQIVHHLIHEREIKPDSRINGDDDKEGWIDPDDWFDLAAAIERNHSIGDFLDYFELDREFKKWMSENGYVKRE